MSSSPSITFTIENIGVGNLTINNISIDDNTNFTLIDNTTSPVAEGDSTSFGIVYNPQLIGGHSTTVTINNNDTDEGTYTFTETGTGKNVFILADTLTGHTFEVWSLSFNHDGTQIVSGSWDDRILVRGDPSVFSHRGGYVNVRVLDLTLSLSS
jgi:WD40 repeat protein